MKTEDLRFYAMYGLSVLQDKSYNDFKESKFTDEKAIRLWHLYNKMWNELFDEEMKETENAPMSL